MDRRAFGLRPLAHVQHYSNLSDSSSEEENDKNYYQSRPQVLRPPENSDYQSSSDSSDNDSDDSTYKSPRNLRNPVPKYNRRNRSMSSDESDWNGSESSSSTIRRSRIKRSGTSCVSYKEKSSGSSGQEEDDEDDSAEDEEEEDEPHESYMAGSFAGDGAEEVEAIEKVLSQRVGRKGATGTETISYNAELSGDPNANLDPDSEETEIQYLIKWKNWSHIHNTWESEESLLAQKVNGMKKLENFKRKDSDLRLRTELANREEIEYLVCQQEITEMLEAQHSLAERIIGSKVNSGSSEYLVKWEGLPYSNSTSEDAELIERLFPKVVEEYFYRRNNTCTPNPSNRALKYRPKFSALREQPARIGHENNLQLRDYQLDGINWLLLAWCKGNCVILADEMGLGKTIQTISFLEVLMSEYEIYGPFLILVPLSTITNWYREFRIWAPHINVIQYLGDAGSRSLIRQEEFSHPQTKKLKFNVLLTTYEILLKDRLILGGISWAVLAVDEAHRLKNDESLLYKSLQPFRTNHRLLITGTPLQNSLKELWALLHFLMPKRYDRWEDFENRHRASDRNGFQSLHAELSPYLLRRVKKDVEKSLPAKTEQILRVEMSNLQKKYYKFILTKNYQELSKEVGGKVSSFINIVMELKKCCNHAFLVKEQENGYAYKNRFEMLVRGSGKMILLDKLLCRLRDTGHRVLIFSQMVRMLDILEEYLRLRRFGFQRLDGSIRGELRKQALDHFNAEGSPDFCFLLSTRAGGLGLNLATADTVIIFDSDWNPQNDLQAQARAHRIGQKNQVSVYRLVTKSSVEEDILERAKKKMVLDHLVIQRMDTTGRTVLNKDSQNSASSFSKDELNAILKFGAEELFKESDDEDAGDIQVDIDDILRRAETRNTEELNNTASGELLSCFKVVSFENLEEEDIEGHQSIVDQGKSWASIIPEIERRRIEDEELHRRLVELNPPPRSRKNCQKINYSEMNNSKKRKRDNDTSSDSDSVQQPKKRGRPKNTYSDLGGLSNSELKRLIKSLKKFGRPIERVQAIAQDGELLDKSQEQLEMLIRTIVRRCEEFQKESTSQLENEDSLSGQRPQTFKLAKVIVNPKSILQSITDLEPLCIWAQHDCKTLPESIHLRNPTFGFPWSRDDDVSLLKGVFQYGFGNWERIREDDKLGLSKILSEADRKSQYKRLSSRVEYLIKKLHKYFDGTAVSKKSKSSVISRKELLNQNNGVLINGSTAEKKSKKSRKVTNDLKDKEMEKVARVESQPLTETDSVYGLSSSVFEKCKEDMRPVRKALKRLDDDADNTECLYIIGNHIKGLLERENDTVVMKQQRSNLWCFVSQFTKCTASEIYRIYRKILKARNPNADANDHSSKKFDARTAVLSHSS